MLIWERDDTHLDQIIIKVRVLSLPDFPIFIIISDGEEFQGESWTVQCEILLQDMLGYVPQDDEAPLKYPNDQEPPFSFFGCGQ